MIVVPLMLCGGPATGCRWIERGCPYRAPRSELRRSSDNPAYPSPDIIPDIMHGMVWISPATLEERRGLRLREAMMGRREAERRLVGGRPVRAAPKFR